MRTDGSYKFSYSTSNGVSRSESGLVTQDGYQVTGSYQYTGPDGVRYTVEFVADQLGYRPKISKTVSQQRRGREILLKPKTRKFRRKRRKRKNVQFRASDMKRRAT